MTDRLVIALVALLLGAFSGWRVTSWSYQAHAAKVATANTRIGNDAALRYAQTQADAYTRAAQIQSQKYEVVHALKARCPILPGDYARLLDDAHGVPSASGPAADASAPASADIAVEHVVDAELENARRFGACRDQLNGLIDWHEATK